MRKVCRIIDNISEWGGKTARWLCILMILVVVFEVFMRYVLNSPTPWGYEVALFSGAALYAIGYSYAERHRSHVRVDVFYIHMSPRMRAIADTIGGFIYFLPTIAFVVFASWGRMFWSWKIGEKSVEGFWYPPLYPLRTVIFIGWTMLLLQGLVTLTRNVYYAVKGRAL